MKRRKNTQEIRDFILDKVDIHPTDIARTAASHLGISREAVVRQLRNLVGQGLLTATGTTRREYKLAWLKDEILTHRITPNLEEDAVWRIEIVPLLNGIAANVMEICQYGFTEMFNNAIEHSASEFVTTNIRRSAVRVEMIISDSGVGIFHKIQHALELSDPRHALLELTKGKLTTDPSHHTGEGIFFTSRMFDYFSILSSDLYFSACVGEDDWLIESETRAAKRGTYIEMRIRSDSVRTKRQIYDKYSSEESNFDFSRTHVPVKLARYGEEQLVSRSQAKRVLARFEKFKEVLLDFKGVATIGHSFADEIFRVFNREHPDVKVFVVNTTPEILEAIQRTGSPLPS